MQKILISSCLLGEQVKYNGGNNLVKSDILDQWLTENRLVPFCPELAGGLHVPRNPVEIQEGEGLDVLGRTAIVTDNKGNDVSRLFTKGAYAALELAQKHAITLAVLKERSPSCGVNFIYTGNFNGSLKQGKGVTARLLEQNGIKTFSETQLEEVKSFLLIS